MLEGAGGGRDRPGSPQGGKQYRPRPPNGQAGRSAAGRARPFGGYARGYRVPVFTGLVQAVGRVSAIERTGRGPMAPVRLRIDPGSWEHRPTLGDSICVSGVCLTVAGRSGGGRGKVRTLDFDVIPETLARTKLGGLRVGDGVNLEHAVTAATLMGGHFVQGHVDGVGRVVSVSRGDDWRVRVRVGRELRALMIPKGSVCVDGVSLTIAAVRADGFEVALIPTTLELTTLAGLRPGDVVNIEADMLVKAVASVVRGMGAGAKGGRARRVRSKSGAATANRGGAPRADGARKGSGGRGGRW